MSDPITVSLSVKGTSGQSYTLQVARLSGSEAISSLFEFTLDVVRSEQHGLGLPDEVVAGRPATLSFSQSGEPLRSVHGILQSVALRFDAARAGQRVYRLRLVPRVWRSRLVTTQQIFMDANVPDTIQKKLGLVGVKGTDVVMNLLADYPVREFIVQYREDDTNFINRLAEHLGIAFHFRHDAGTDQIVFSDHNDGFYRNPAVETIAATDRLDEPNRIYQLERNSRMIPALYVVYDYNYRKPELSLLAKKKLEGGHGGGVVEYGAHIKSVEEGEVLAAIRAEELHCREADYTGESSIFQLSAGLLTSVENCDDLNGDVLVTRVEHRAEMHAEGGEGLIYSNKFSALVADRTFRPERLAPRPSITGFVTGVVQGADGATDGQYALLDEHGRYIVQFHFDSALGKLNSKASRPVRMAQPFAGSGEGMHMPLKPGTEVAIAFAGGDPDRPVIIGALPNHTKPSVVTASNSTINKLSTDNGITIQFGRLS